MFPFYRRYFVLALLFLITEVCIALFIRDSFVRPYVGDYLVVMLVYCAVQTVLNASPLRVAIGVLLFAFLVEFLQYLELLTLLGLQKSTIGNVVLGSHFEWIDMLAYTLGVATIVYVEMRRNGKSVYR